MRIAFLAGGSIRNRLAWSGTIYYAHSALAKRFDVVALEMPRMTKALRGVRKALRPTGFDPLREPLCADLFSTRAARMVAKSRADAVFVLGASHIAAGLAERFPVFHCSDSTFSALLNYHGEFSAFSRRTVRSGTELERRVISRSRAVIVASQAAALSVRRDYGREEGVHVVPFGANLDHLPEIDSWERKPECSLVFIGVQWFSKGADVALEACRLLNERGIPAVLHVVGCSPPPGTNVPPFIKLHGFLRKSVPHEYAQLTSLVAKSDFLIVPTRYEAFGIVFCEAAAHGTPAVSRRTGGVPTIIDDGVTGILVDEGKGPECYADRIQRVWCDEGAYVRMRRAAFTKARSTLNWDSWSAHVESIIRASMGRPSAP